MIPSLHESTGLSIAYADPLCKAVRCAFLGTLQAEVNNYEHELGAMGGYVSARLALAVTRAEAEEWFENGLARHVEVYSPRLEVVWEGFVDQVSLSAGQYAATRGPLTELANRVYAVYSERDTTTDPPTVIPGMITVIVQDTDSQARWGIWEKAITCGETDAAGAQYARDTWLAEYAEPIAADPRIVFEAGGQVSVSLDCLGYWAWMLAYPYQDLGTGTVTAQTKVLDILAADPNGVFSADHSQVDYNADLAPAYEDSGTPAWDVLKSLVARGDVFDERWTFGFYAGRVPYYKNIPAKERYQYRLADPSQRVETVVGGDVEPWDVRPGEWLYQPDFLTGREQPLQAANRRTDPRYVFIESVRFRAPYTVEVTGTRVGKMAQILARQGLGATA